MQIAILMKGKQESTDHILFMNAKELSLLIKVFESFCDANKRQKNALKMKRQFENEIQIY